MADLAAARLNMVESQVRPNDVTDVRLHDFMRTFARETLAPASKAHLAYADAEIEYAPGRWMLRPRDISKLLQAVRPVPGEKALAIAAPYAAAAMQALGCSVTRADSDSLTAAEGGTYDLIVVEGAVPKAPTAWTSALANGGRLAVVERDGPVGRAVIYLRTEAGVARTEVFDATPPVLGGFEREAGFTF